MRIIQLVQKPQLRGAEIFACQLANHLINLGHDVIVVTIFEGDSELPFKGNVLHLNRPISKRLFDSGGWKEFNNIVKNFKPEIIQANAADTLKFAVSSKLLFRWDAKIIFRNANKMGDFINSKLKWHLNKFYINKVDHVISVSKECQKDFIETFDYSNNLINTVEIGVEEAHVKTIPHDLEKVFNKGQVLTHIGGFVPEKNHDGLIRIFSKLKENYPTLQLLLLGKGQLENQIQEKIKDSNLASDVHFLGHRTDVLEILKASHAFVLPSLIEGLPAVILEAMYCNTPVIAYNVGGISEVVIPGKTGWLINKGDEKNFIQAVQEVLNPDIEHNFIIETAKNQIQNNFLNSRIAKRFERVYQNVLSD